MKLVRAGLLTLIIGAIVGCSSAPSPEKNRPEDFGATQTTSLNRYVDYPVWSVSPDEMLVNGVHLQDAIDVAVKAFGKPSKSVGVGAANSGQVDYYFTGNVRVETKNGRIVLIEIPEGYTAWTTSRGISAGSSCESVVQRFGPSHDGPDTYVYYSATGPRQLVFGCKDGRVIRLTMSGAS